MNQILQNEKNGSDFFEKKKIKQKRKINNLRGSSFY